MKKRIKPCLFIISILFVLASCKSTPKDISDCIYVMVYDYENNALKDVQVIENGNVIGTTDIYGRYTYEKKDSGMVQVSFCKQGYEKIDVQIENQQNQVLYVKLGSGMYFAALSEDCFDEKKYDDALKYINKALKCVQRKDYEYLKNLILSRKHDE